MSGIKYKSKEQIERIFYPESVAVVGANRVKGTVPYDMLHNILKDNYKGTVFPVSPREKSIAGVKAYKYVIDIEDEVDMAILVFPSSVCHLALEQCGEKGVKSAIIISAGFREIGGDGVQREKRIKEIADKYGISFIGPNCLGIINTDPGCNLNASFARNMPENGNIAFLSQSGALCTAVLDYARAKHIGFSKFVSFGNKADVSEIDLLYYLKDDPKTKVILLYLEEVSDGRSLMKVSRKIIRESGKPILILKSGRTDEGASAAASHTGSLAGSDDVCDAAFTQAGIIRCDTIEDMFNFAIGLVYQPLPRGNRVAIITNAGGPGVLATDMTIKENLSLARFSEKAKEVLKKSLPGTANICNPVDVIGDARVDRYNVALSSVLQDENVDGALVILTPQSMTDIKAIAEEICRISCCYNKPVYASFMGESDVSIGVDILQRRKIPHYQLPENMCKAFARSYRFNRQLKKEYTAAVVFKDVDTDRAHTILNEAIMNDRWFLSEAETVNIMEAYKMPVLPGILAVSEKDVGRIAGSLGYPVVMKVSSEKIVHKSDVGGVILNIRDGKEAEAAYQTILNKVSRTVPDARINGVFIQKMAAEGEEVILGLKRDPSFGSVIMFGLGGIFVEIFRDVSFRVAPIEKNEVAGMVQDIKSYPILTGVRGRSEKDLESLKECIQRLSQLAVECTQISELDINPLIVMDRGKGCYVTDIKIMLGTERRKSCG